MNVPARRYPSITRGLVGLLSLVLIVALFPASIIAIEAPARADQTSEPVGRTDRVLVRWSTRLSATAAGAPARLAALASASGRGPAFVRFTGSGAAVYDFGAPLGPDAGAILAALSEAEGVATVEPDVWMTADTLPIDPRAAELWGLLGVTDGSSYGIDAPGAWATSAGSGVVVAVIDTGLAAHEDLSGQAVAGYDMIGDIATANDGDGRDENAADPGDWCGINSSSWHGTHVAGTIAALSSNGIGVFGGSPGVKIQPVRVLGTCGGYSSDVADGIRWAAGGSVPGVPANLTPARVLNLSLGGAYPCPAEYSSAISDARTRGAVVVVSAGNSAMDASGSTPANCNGVITVAATGQAGQRASFSNYGSVVELSGPGVSILSTVDSGTTVPTGSAYAYYGGTSMAAPHVALTAALLAAAAPTLTPAQIEAILADTSTPFGADSSATGCPALGCGAGIAHAARAVASLNTDTTGPTGSVSIESGAATTSSTAVSVAVPATDPSGVSQVRLSNDPGMGAVTRVYAATQSWTLAAGADGTRTVYVQWQDGVGNWSGVSSDSITLDTTAPAGGVSIAGGAAATTSTAISIDVAASDASGLSQVRLSNDPGMAGAVTRAYATPQSWTLAAGADGSRTVYVQWQDGVGNWSGVSSDSITVDTTGPAGSAPSASLVNGAALDKTTVPVRLAWSGSDAGSGLARFELALSTNGGVYVPLALPSPTATTHTPLLSPGSATYRFRVRAIDAAGNASAWAAGPRFYVRRIQESSTAIRYAGTWSRVSATAALGGRYRLTTRARASATYTFTGRSVAWVANRGTAFGSARVYIDGVYRGTVNLRASSAWRRIVFSRTWASSGRHTIRIVGSGTAGHPRVSLDAFVVLQ
jgi:serine protease